MVRHYVIVCVASLMIAIGLLLGFTYESISNFVMIKILALTPTSRTFFLWQKTPMPINLRFYVFNWTNPEELLLPGFKPKLVELGPYAFKEYMEKVNVTWNDNKTISFQRKRVWIPDEENSNGSLSDRIVALNPVAVSAAFVSRGFGSFMQFSLSNGMRLTGQRVWTAQTVGDFLFHGYPDTMLSVASKLPSVAQGPAWDRFAWFYRRNVTTDHEVVLNMETGEDDISRLAQVRSADYSNRSQSFSAECGRIKGSVGDLNAPGQTRERPLEVYNGEFCKALQLDYVADTTVEGIPGYTYEGGRRMLDPANWCNCVGECPPQGVLNISSCHFGAPAFVSFPHFLHADSYYTNQVDGLRPDPEKHRFYVTLEPTTGIPLDVAARFQINLLLQPQPHIALFRDVPTVYFPVLWCEEFVSIPHHLALQLNLLLHLPTAGLCLCIVLIAAGFVLLVTRILPRHRPPSSPQLQKRDALKNKSKGLLSVHCIRSLIDGNQHLVRISAEESNLLESKAAASPEKCRTDEENL